MRKGSESEERVTVEVPWPMIDGKIVAGMFDTGRMQREDLDVLNNHQPSVISFVPGADSKGMLERVLKGHLTESQMLQLQNDIQEQIDSRDVNELQDIAKILKDCVPEETRIPKIREDFEKTGILWVSFRIPNTQISIGAKLDGRKYVITITEAGVSMYVEVCGVEEDLFALYCD